MGLIATTIPPEPPRSEDRAAFLEAVLEAVAEGVLVAREDRIVEANQALCEMTGFERPELVGAELPFPFLPPDETERFHAFLAKLSERRRADIELSLARKDGSRFAAHITVAPAQTPAGRSLRVLSIRNISERRRREKRLTELAAKDALTGLLNKRSFARSLTGEIARARRHGRPLSLAILDLDGFKRINDHAGHMEGDRVLAEAAGRLGALVRTGEHMARVGGDEFGWILPEADAEGAAAAVNRARLAIAAEGFRGMGSLTLSAGICVSDGGIPADEVYRQADRALYAAKQAGGNGVVVY